MEVTYQLTQQDFFESFIAHRNRSSGRKWSLRFMATAIFVLLGIGLLGAIMRPYPRAWSNLTPLLILAGVYAGLLWALPWWSARNQFSKQPRAQRPRTMLVDQTGVHWKWNGGSSNVEWNNFIRFLECEHQLLLYSSPACFSIVPKRALLPAQLDDFRALLAQNVSHTR